jgi:predicted Zn-dependent protease
MRDVAELAKRLGRQDITKELLIKITVLHEVGHQFGLGENTGGVMDQSLLDEKKAILTGKHIKEIRKNAVPGGK